MSGVLVEPSGSCPVAQRPERSAADPQPARAPIWRRRDGGGAVVRCPLEVAGARSALRWSCRMRIDDPKGGGFVPRRPSAEARDRWRPADEEHRAATRSAHRSRRRGFAARRSWTSAAVGGVVISPTGLCGTPLDIGRCRGLLGTPVAIVWRDDDRHRRWQCLRVDGEKRPGAGQGAPLWDPRSSRSRCLRGGGRALAGRQELADDLVGVVARLAHRLVLVRSSGRASRGRSSWCGRSPVG